MGGRQFEQECKKELKLMESQPETIYHKISEEKARELAAIRIEECNFSFRTYNVLKKHLIDNLLDLASVSEDYLRGMKNCGNKSVKEMIECLKKHDIIETPVYNPNIDIDEIKVQIFGSPDDKAQEIADALERLKTVPIEDAHLSVRAYNCLSRYGIKTLYGFAIMSLEEAYQIPSLGRSSIKEISGILKTYGIDYPIEEVDLSDLHPSIKYIGISEEALNLLNNSGILLLDDLKNLSDNQLYELLSICSEEDSLRIIYCLSTIKNIQLTKEYFDSYLKYVVHKIAEGLKESDRLILFLSFGLFGEKEWPQSILSSSLAIDETKLEKKLNDILQTYLSEVNYSRLEPLINYYENNSSFIYKNGYHKLLERIIEQGNIYSLK